METLGAIVLQDDDLPDWTGADYQADPNEAADNAAMQACVGGRDTDPDRIAEVHSQDYSLGDATIGSDASLFSSPVRPDRRHRDAAQPEAFAVLHHAHSQ